MKLQDEISINLITHCSNSKLEDNIQQAILVN
jgi:hypothetical protein